MRTELLRLRVTADEKKLVDSNAATAGLTTSDFIRASILHTKPVRRVATPNQELLIRLKGEIGKIGSNVNQIARALNQRNEDGKITPVPDKVIINAMNGVDTLTKHLLELITNGH